MNEPARAISPEALDARLDACMLADAARLSRRREALLARGADARQWSELAAAVEASAARRADRKSVV